MRKIIFLLFILFIFFSLTNFAIAESNIVKLPDTLRSSIHTLNGSANNGTSSYAYDENFSTGYGSNNSRNDGGYDLYVISEHIFPRAINLNKIFYSLSAFCRANGKYIRTHNYYMYVEYEVDGRWYELPGSRYEGGGGEGATGYETGQIYYNSPINNVQGLRATVHSYGLATGGEGRAEANGWIYEIQGWGENYVDIGLRAYDGQNIIKIACEPSGVLISPLRINKNGNTYAIALVDPIDARASKIRIMTSSGIKALAKIN